MVGFICEFLCLKLTSNLIQFSKTTIYKNKKALLSTHQPPTTHIHSTHIRKSRETKPTFKKPSLCRRTKRPNLTSFALPQAHRRSSISCAAAGPSQPRRRHRSSHNTHRHISPNCHSFLGASLAVARNQTATKNFQHVLN